MSNIEKVASYLKTSASWRINGNTAQLEKQDYSIDIEKNKNKWVVSVTIKSRDSVNQIELNDSSDKWTQFHWGYEIKGSNNSQLEKTLKILKATPLPKTFLS